MLHGTCIDSILHFFFFTESDHPGPREPTCPAQEVRVDEAYAGAAGSRSGPWLDYIVLK